MRQDSMAAILCARHPIVLSNDVRDSSPKEQAAYGPAEVPSSERSTVCFVKQHVKQALTPVPHNPPTREIRFVSMPPPYEMCDRQDLAALISSMFMELMRHNDAMPHGRACLTRFHAKTIPPISVPDYLQHLTAQVGLSSTVLLSMVYYADRLCKLCPAFTISSLTVHRFLLTSGLVASKGLEDAFLANRRYARVSGVSLRELAVLELELLKRIEWRIIPKAEVLASYYRSLVARSDEYSASRKILDGNIRTGYSHAQPEMAGPILALTVENGGLVYYQE